MRTLQLPLLAGLTFALAAPDAGALAWVEVVREGDAVPGHPALLLDGLPSSSWYDDDARRLAGDGTLHQIARSGGAAVGVLGWTPGRGLALATGTGTLDDPAPPALGALAYLETGRGSVILLGVEVGECEPGLPEGRSGGLVVQEPGGALRVVAACGDAAMLDEPGPPSFASFHTFAIPEPLGADGSVSFLAELSDGSTGLFHADAAGQIHRVAREGDAAPGIPDGVLRFGWPGPGLRVVRNEAGALGLLASVSLLQRGGLPAYAWAIYVWTAEQGLSLLASRQVDVEGAFADVDTLAIDGVGRVYWLGSRWNGEGETEAALVRAAAGTEIEVLLRVGDSAPGLPGETLDDFEEGSPSFLVDATGGLAFVGWVGQDMVLFGPDGQGALGPRLRTGFSAPPLAPRVLWYLDPPRGLAADGRIALSASYEDPGAHAGSVHAIVPKAGDVMLVLDDAAPEVPIPEGSLSAQPVGLEYDAELAHAALEVEGLPGEVEALYYAPVPAPSAGGAGAAAAGALALLVRCRRDFGV